MNYRYARSAAIRPHFHLHCTSTTGDNKKKCEFHTSRCYAVFYKLLIVDDTHSTRSRKNTFTQQYQFMNSCICVWMKENIEGYQSCAHFCGALSIPHQHCYHIEQQQQLRPLHIQRKMTTIKIATHVMCYAFNRIHERFSRSVPFPNRRFVLLVSLTCIHIERAAKHTEDWWWWYENAPSLRKMYLYNFKHV